MLLNTARRMAITLLTGGLLAALAPHPASHAASAARGAQPPHAWLFGTWAGGILPAPAHMSSTECLAHASFEVSQDIVMHSTLTHPAPIHNLIVSVRGTPDGTIFVLAPPSEKPAMIAGVPVDLGFGCPHPNVLRVVRVGPNEIRFPDCTGFPSPLVRCVAPR